ncbi:Inosine-5'-monophosphate dehydrogenase [Roseimaritima multifibrata]|uniref:Inosine-5'-monophosphate dehydrogenase n=1 Tax=Roseimaritima multifibrata TaxID=1930274 RepID=A0A517MLB7_9BACT|nr:CBS domain-containing protein [Roseimaritima multifibrata]QDS95640.1 Inosine-5'-monophosphate dehydrogenase [Roseimaritima multifibrata]
MKQTVTARDMMVSNLVTLSPEMDVLDAIDVLLKRHISGAPVVDSEGRFLGIFSEKSCMQFAVGALYDQLPSNNLMAFVDTNPPAVDEETDLLSIAQKFLDAACRRLPVLDFAGRLSGQISRRDVMKVVQHHLRGKDGVKAGAGLYISAVVVSGERPV